LLPQHTAPSTCSGGAAKAVQSNVWLSKHAGRFRPIGERSLRQGAPRVAVCAEVGRRSRARGWTVNLAARGKTIEQRFGTAGWTRTTDLLIHSQAL